MKKLLVMNILTTITELNTQNIYFFILIIL